MLFILNVRYIYIYREREIEIEIEIDRERERESRIILWIWIYPAWELMIYPVLRKGGKALPPYQCKASCEESHILRRPPAIPRCTRVMMLKTKSAFLVPPFWQSGNKCNPP